MAGDEGREGLLTVVDAGDVDVLLGVTLGFSELLGGTAGRWRAAGMPLSLVSGTGQRSPSGRRCDKAHPDRRRERRYQRSTRTKTSRTGLRQLPGEDRRQHGGGETGEREGMEEGGEVERAAGGQQDRREDRRGRGRKQRQRWWWQLVAQADRTA